MFTCFASAYVQCTLTNFMDVSSIGWDFLFIITSGKNNIAKKFEKIQIIVQSPTSVSTRTSFYMSICQIRWWCITIKKKRLSGDDFFYTCGALVVFISSTAFCVRINLIRKKSHPGILCAILCSSLWFRIRWIRCQTCVFTPHTRTLLVCCLQKIIL